MSSGPNEPEKPGYRNTVVGIRNATVLTAVDRIYKH